MHSPKSKNELRCFCLRRPLLAVYGLDSHNCVYVHIKVYKNRRVYGEVLVKQGSQISIRCRECLRWYSLSLSTSVPKLIEIPVPETLEQDDLNRRMFDPTPEQPLR